MGKGEFIKKFLAGLFVILGAAILVIVIFVIGLERGFSEPKFQVTVLFKEVGGMTSGAPIRISGVSVGVVGEIEFLDEEIAGRRLKVTLNIFKKYENQFKKCSRVGIKTEGVLGEKFIEISADKAYPEFDPTEPILGQEILDVENVAKIMTDTAASLQKTSNSVNVMIGELDLLSRKSRRLMNRFEEKLIEGNLFKVF